MDLKTLQKLNIQYPNDIEFAKVIREIIWEKEKQQAIQNKNNSYIYERNPDTGNIYRRKRGNYKSKELIYGS